MTFRVFHLALACAFIAHAVPLIAAAANGPYFFLAENPNVDDSWRIATYNGDHDDIPLGPNERLLATAFYNASLSDIGWDVLRIGPNPDLFEEGDPWLAYYAHGYLEGFITQERIKQHFLNTYLNWIPDPQHEPLIEKFVTFAKWRAEEPPSTAPTESIEGAVFHAYRMLKGMQDGYNDAAAAHNELLSFAEFVMMANVLDIMSFYAYFDVEKVHWAGPLPPGINVSDIPTQPADTTTRAPSSLSLRERTETKATRFRMLEAARLLQGTSSATGANATTTSHIPGYLPTPPPRPRPTTQAAIYNPDPNIAFNPDRCSAGLTITDEGKVLIGHTTWWMYDSMLRIHKTYLLEHTVVLSSYPGCIHSTDDFIATSNGIVLTETTNDVGNSVQAMAPTLADPSKIPTSVRVLAAAVFSVTPQNAIDTLLYNNSGSDCADWLIVDMKAYDVTASTNEERIQNGFAHILETWPANMSIVDDVSDAIRERGYISLNNCPYFTNLFPLSGLPNISRAFDCAYNIRASMYRRASRNAHSVQDLGVVLRANDFMRDPLLVFSWCPKHDCYPASSSALAIACRRDIVPANRSQGPIAAVDVYMGEFGGIDAKTMDLTAFYTPQRRVEPSGVWPSDGTFNLSMRVISSPTYSDGGPRKKQTVLPPFKFSEKHEGLPLTMKFDWVNINSVDGVIV